MVKPARAPSVASSRLRCSVRKGGVNRRDTETRKRRIIKENVSPCPLQHPPPDNTISPLSRVPVDMLNHHGSEREKEQTTKVLAISSTPKHISTKTCVEEYPGNPLTVQHDLLSSTPICRGRGTDVQRKSFMTTPSKDSRNSLLLSNWGIPDKVLAQYAKRNIKAMFEWQAECLQLPTVLTGGNIVYSAPTSAGKTLVAELLALKCVLEARKKVLIILPFVSIAHEKLSYLQGILEPQGVRVGGFMGNRSPPGGYAAVDIAVCTIEKANSLINRLLEERDTHNLGVVVVDEVHMIGDEHRGYLLELLLTKLLYVGKVGKNRSQPVQIIGMSATLPNIEILAQWLGAQLYKTDFRPTPLHEMVKIGPTLYDTDFNELREYNRCDSAPGDEDDILTICRERLIEGHSVLIFCPTKAWCEKLASTIAESHAGLVHHHHHNRSQGQGQGTTTSVLDQRELVGVCEQLRRTQVGLDRVLEKTVPSGVAYHHAGLTFEEREIVEGAFRQMHIKVLVATSTLSSGVNLPARLVIVRTPFFQRSLLDLLVYKQMVGRAGRKGVDELGESILMCKPSDRAKVVGLFKSSPKLIHSCLCSEAGLRSGKKSASKSGLAVMKRALLEIVASGIASTREEVQLYASSTLYYAELAGDDSNMSAGSHDERTKALTGHLDATLMFLLQHDFVSTRVRGGVHPPDAPPSSSSTEELAPTQLGVATITSALSPDEALVVFRELRKARRNFVLENELHTIYLVTPVYIQEQWPNIDWYKYLCLWERLSPDMRHVADTLGVRESFLAQAVQGRIPERTDSQQESHRVHRRFFTALALHDLVHEVPIRHVARQYGATKGLLQTLQSAAGTFAGMVTVFCNRLGWKNLELLLSQFQSRLMFGVEGELCGLVRVSLLNGFRARVLYNAGYHTLAALASANPALLEVCLRNAVPFKSYKLGGGQGGGVADECADSASGVCNTWCTKLRKGMTESEASAAIVSEARAILSSDLNLSQSAWNIRHPVRLYPATTATDTATATAGKSRARGGVAAAVVRGPGQPTQLVHQASPCDVTTVTTTTAAATHGCRGRRKSPTAGHLKQGHPCSKKPKSPLSVHQEHSSSNAVGFVCGHERSPLALSPIGTIVGPRSSFAPPLGLGPPTGSNGVIEGNGTSSQDAILEGGLPPRSVPKFQSNVVVVGRVPSLLGELSPIGMLGFGDQSVINAVTSDIPEARELSFDGEHCSNNKGNLSVERIPCTNIPDSLNIPCTIPDSLSCSADVSMSFSFHTLAMIDAVCDAAKPSVPCSPDGGTSSRTAAGGGGGGGSSAETSLCRADKQLSLSNCISQAMDEYFPTNDSCRSLRPDTSFPDQQLEADPLDRSEHIPETPSRFHVSGLKELSSLCSSQLSQSGVTLINVTSNRVLFDTFVSECLEQKAVAFSVAYTSIDQSDGIGSVVVKPTSSSGVPILPLRNEQVMGVAFCWGDTDVYFISLSQPSGGGSGGDGGGGGPELLRASSSSADSISLADRVGAITKLFESPGSSWEKLIAYDMKKHAKYLALSCGVMPRCHTQDPLVADWILNPDAKEKTIHRMVLQYLADQPLLSECEEQEEMPLSSLATNGSDPEMQASAECILAHMLATKLQVLLEAEGLCESYLKLEMPSLLILAKTELNGIGFSPDECARQRDVLQRRVLELEREAYTLAGHTFSLTSPDDVASVLFLELKLPPGGTDPGTAHAPSKQRTLGAATRRTTNSRRRRVQHLSTAKDVLEKIRTLHPLPGIVLEWRRISSTMSKTVYPLFKEAVAHEGLECFRIHATAQIHTATGRVSVSDPSLQMVPKEFDIGGHNRGPGSASAANPSLLSDSQYLEARDSDRHDDTTTSTETTLPSSVCMRSVFTPFPGGVFLSADYSQLELRVLAHMSGDAKLRRFLNGDGDAFRMIAGEWLGLPPAAVSDKQRQDTKQLCYGILYGIGPRALGEQMGISDNEASMFMETFRSKYPTMKRFISKTVHGCRDVGYVTTLLGRKRFLPAIHSANIHARSQAERQAVNSTIQGSAADLVKTAMVNVDRVVRERYGVPATCLLPVPPGGVVGAPPRHAAYLVLQLHDELLYEVLEQDLQEVAEIVRHEMENALQLSVRFPVKVKAGYSWGKLEPLSL